MLLIRLRSRPSAVRLSIVVYVTSMRRSRNARWSRCIFGTCFASPRRTTRARLVVNAWSVKFLRFESFTMRREIVDVDEQERARLRNQGDFAAEDFWLAFDRRRDTPSTSTRSAGQGTCYLPRFNLQMAQNDSGSAFGDNRPVRSAISSSIRTELSYPESTRRLHRPRVARPCGIHWPSRRRDIRD